MTLQHERVLLRLEIWTERRFWSYRCVGLLVNKQAGPQHHNITQHNNPTHLLDKVTRLPQTLIQTTTTVRHSPSVLVGSPETQLLHP